MSHESREQLLKKFYEYWEGLVRKGSVSNLTAIELSTLKIFLSWLEDNGKF